MAVFGLILKIQRVLLSLFLILLWINLLFSSQAIAQKDTIVCKSYTHGQIIQVPSGFLLDSSSVQIQDSGWTFINNRINKNVDSHTTSVEVCFRSVKVESKILFKRSLDHYEPATFSTEEKMELYTTGKQKNPESGLKKKGEITRGFIVGNNQNTALNSSLFLDVQGKLTDDLWLNLLMTDQQATYQPEGNTQQLRDFDLIRFSLFSEKFRIDAGDILLQDSARVSPYLKFNRNLLGAHVSHHFQNKGIDHSVQLGAGMAKGTFSSQLIQPQEGVIGPYRLRGNQNENFIIVLAGSERVFLDGVLQKRGEEQDYVIDYNLGELTFTSTKIITRYSRIRVDFEYASQVYPRHAMTYAHQVKIGQWRLEYQQYREADQHNRLLLTSIDTSAFAEFASTFSSVLSLTTADSVGVTPYALLYRKVDTLINNQPETYFEYAPEKTDSYYRVSFHYVGPKKGSYIKSNTLSNGTVYLWTPPNEIGEKQGDFEPIQSWSAPQKKIIHAAGLHRTFFDNKLKMHHQVMQSSHHMNRYNSEAIQKGWAQSLGMEWEKIGVSSFYFSGKIQAELLSPHFSYIDRFREVDFDRNWGSSLRTDTLFTQDKILAGEFQLAKEGMNMHYQSSFREKDSYLKGWQHNWSLDNKWNSFFYRGRAKWAETIILDNTSRWWSYQAEVGHTFEKMEYGLFAEFEKNSQLDKEQILISSLQHYSKQGAFFDLRSGEGKKVVSSRMSHRTDWLPLEGQWEKATDAYQGEVEVVFRKSKEAHIQANISTLYQKDLISETYNPLIQGKWSSSHNWLKKWVKSSLTYGINRTRQPARSFIFTRVLPGQGTHTWRDVNQNNSQELDEFYLAINPDERNFARFFLPTESYLPSTEVSVAQQMRLQAPNFTSQPVLKELYKLSAELRTKYVRNQQGNKSKNLLPYLTSDNDNLLSGMESIIFSTFYNQNTGTISLANSFEKTNNQQLIVSGKDQQASSKNYQSILFRIDKYWSFNLLRSWTKEKAASDWQIDRNYRLITRTLQSGLEHQKNRSRWYTEVGISVLSTDPTKKSGSGQRFNIKQSFLYQAKQQNQINVSCEWFHVDIKETVNDYVYYIITDGTSEGSNFRMTVHWQKPVNERLHINVHYFGRKSESLPLMHTGQMTLTAKF